MKATVVLCALALVCALSPAPARASDYSDVYARIDKVVFEPSAEAPERVQIWGVFAISEKFPSATDYQPAKRGYLYFQLGQHGDPRSAPDTKVIATEWNDLKRVAGTGQIVSFGLRMMDAPRFRKADEKPADPDRYLSNTGVVKVSSDTDYPPIKSIADFKD